MDKQINHDKHHDESKPRTHILSKLPDDGDPWAPHSLLTLHLFSLEYHNTACNLDFTDLGLKKMQVN